MTSMKKIFVGFIIFLLIAVIFTPIDVIAIEQKLTFSNVNITSVDTSAVITFSTNLPTNARVDFGLKTEYGLFLQEGNQKKRDHIITLSGLEPEKTYHYRITIISAVQETVTFDGIFKTKKFIDTKAPTITDVVSYYVTGSTATVRWYTDKPTTSVVTYGPTSQYGKTVSSSSLVYIHDVTIKGLKMAATYHFNVISKDAHGNIVKFHDQTFRTNLTGDAENLLFEISNVRPLASNDENIGDTMVIVSWQTNKLSDGRVKFGKTEKFGKTLLASPPRDFFHTITLTSLETGTRYYYQVESTDVFGKKAVSPIFSFITGSAGRGSDSISVTSETLPSTFYGSAPLFEREDISDEWKENLTFYANFDQDFNPYFARGASAVEIFQNPRIIESGAGSTQKSGDFRMGYVSYASEKNFELGEGTITLWFQPQWEKDKNNIYFLFETSPSYKSFSEKYFQITNRKGIVQFEIEDNTEADIWTEIVKTQELEKDQWYFIAVTWRYNGGKAEVFFNGKKMLSRGRNAGSILKEMPSYPSKFYIGSPRYKGGGSFIDEIAIFNKVLSEEGIQRMYKYGLGTVSVMENSGLQKESSFEQKSDSTSSFTRVHSFVRPEGLYHLKGTPDIYSIVRGKKHYIANPKSFESYGYQWSEVKTVSEKFLNTFPDARLVRSPQNQKVYFLFQRPQKKWLKIHIPSSTAFISYPKNFWGDIVIVNEIDLNSYPDAKLIKLELEVGVYYLEGDTKRLIVSAEAFEKHGFSWSEILEVNQQHFDAYITGEIITADTLL